ncbi:MAG: hypothetical protein WD010_01265, partial [Nitriliruptor sp.]
RVVLSGEVDALRAAGERRLHVGAAMPVDWRSLAADEALLAHASDHEATFVLTPDADPVGVLDGVRRTTSVTAVSLTRPRLSELFRDAVGSHRLDPPSGPTAASSERGAP